MKARVIRSFIDKNTMEDVDKGKILEINEERFSELTAGPQGIFVEEIKEELIIGLDLANGKDMTVINGKVVESNKDDDKIDSIAFTKMKKEEIVKYAKEVKNIELNMDMTRAEMIELLEE